MGCLPKFSRTWKWPKVILALMVIELGGSIAALALFGIAEPNTYRTKLWQIGYDNGFNSNPKQILYAYANHRPIPKTAFVWSGMLTQFNVAIAVLSTFIMIVKVPLFVLHIWYPLLGTITNLALSALYIASLYGQAGPDYSDARYPSSSAWYITKSCSFAKPSGNEGYCQQAKASFAVTVIMIALFLANMIIGIWSLIPTAAQRAAAKVEFDDMQVSSDSPSSYNKDAQWEMKSVPRASATPFTPRTLAFNTLDRKDTGQKRWA